jgi:nucleoside-diphosphate-sugar epimerase
MATQTTFGSLPTGKVVVLGGTGLIGRHVIEALGAAGVGDVAATYRARRPFEGHDTEWRQVDLLDLDAARAVLAKARTAIMCAGKVSTAPSCGVTL